MKARRKTGQNRLDKSLIATRKQIRTRFRKMAARGTLSKVHDLTHVESVSAHAGVIAEELALRHGFSKKSARRTRTLAEASGMSHDIVRRKSERRPHGIKGAKLIMLLRQKFPHAFGEFTAQELKIISDSTFVHERTFSEFNKAIKNFSPRKKIIAKSVHIADKLFEASGYRVLDRRAFFVGKERLQKGAKKNLFYFWKLYGKKAPLYAVAMESCMRLRAINVLKDYPQAIQPIAKPLHAVQEKWYFGLLKNLGLNESRLVTEMEKVKFPKFDKLGAKVKAEVKKANSNSRIQAINMEVANSAAELVFHFNKASSPESALKNWKPKGKQAKEWLKGMKAARIGGKAYLQKLQRQIHRALAK